MYQYRDTLVHPRLLDYSIGNLIGALIPFSFAVCLERKRWIPLAAFCTLSLLLYPVTLTKMALFLALFLLFMALLARNFEARISVILSLLIPLAIGVFCIFLVNYGQLP